MMRELHCSILKHFLRRGRDSVRRSKIAVAILAARPCLATPQVRGARCGFRIPPSSSKNIITRRMRRARYFCGPSRVRTFQCLTLLDGIASFYTSRSTRLGRIKTRPQSRKRDGALAMTYCRPGRSGILPSHTMAEPPQPVDAFPRACAFGVQFVREHLRGCEKLPDVFLVAPVIP